MRQPTRVYAYMRFSSDAQADGYSFERQRETALRWTRNKNIPDSIVEFIEDPGFSAFTGAHLSKGELGKLLFRLETTPREGDELILFEAVDRLSRQGVFTFHAIVQAFLQTGVYIYFDGEQQPFSKKEPADPSLQIKLTMLASLAEQESRRKSQFSSNNWKNRRKAARDSGAVFTRECPRWLSVVDGKFIPIAERVESINAVFKLARDGCGIGHIVRRANSENWPAPSKTSTWHNSLINRLFSNRSLIGEFQPHIRVDGEKIADGDPILNYYPTVIDPNLFHSVRGLRAVASCFPHRRDSNNYNYLMGLAYCACGASLRRLNKNSGKQLGYAQYGCANRVRGYSKCKNIPSKFFDNYFIVRICEKVSEFSTRVQSDSTVRIDALKAKIKESEQKIERVEALSESEDLDRDARSGFVQRLNKLYAQRREFASELEKLTIVATVDASGFSADDASRVYVPAFLTHHENLDSNEAKLAFSARALFRSRLIAAVERVSVSDCRTVVSVQLKNNQSFDFFLPDLTEDPEMALYGSAAESDLTDEEIEEDRNFNDEIARKFMNQ
jgi:DNA invertase Pin-like site-specific DNA recombinase